MFLYAVSRRVCQPRSCHTLRPFSCTTSNSRKDRFLESLVSEYAAQAKQAEAAGTLGREDFGEATPEDATTDQASHSQHRWQQEMDRRQRRSDFAGTERGSGYNTLYEMAENDEDYIDFDKVQQEDEDVPSEARTLLESLFREDGLKGQGEDTMKALESEVGEIFRKSQEGNFDPNDAGEKQFTTYDFAVLEKKLEASGQFAARDTEYDPNWTDEERAMREEIDSIKARLPEDGSDPEIEAQIDAVLAEEEKMQEAVAKLLPGSSECATPKWQGMLVDKYVLGTAKEKIAAEFLRLKLQTWNEAFPHVENMIISLRKRAPFLKRKLQLELRRIQNRREKYSEINLAKAKRAKQKRKEFLATVRNDKDWYFYPEINLWIHRHYLEYAHVRASIRTILNNVSFTKKQKKEAIEALVIYIRNAEEKPKEWYSRRRKLFYEGIAKFDNVSSVQSPDLIKDPNFELPQTYEELIARAEAEMSPEDRAARYAPPQQKGSRNKKHINEY